MLDARALLLPRATSPPSPGTRAIAGAAGNLGAVFCGLRGARTRWTRGRTDPAPLRADVEDRASVVFRSIETLRAPAPRPRRANPSTAGRDAPQRLASALDAYDLSAASDALADLDTAGLGAWAADEYSGLCRRVDAYEYDEARAIAARLLARVTIQRGRG